MEEGEAHEPFTRRSLDRWWLACGLGLLGIALSALVGVMQHRDNQQHERKRFDQVTDAATAMLQTQLAMFDQGLRGARGAIIAAGPQLDRDRFRAYSASRDYAREFPGIRGYGYIQRVAAEDHNAFIEAARTDGMPDFKVHTLAPNDGERFVIRYMEPMVNNEAALGLDIASDPVRRAAAELAARSGQASFTPPITLVQEAGLKRHGFLLLLPIYASHNTPGTAEERWMDVRGWVVAPLTIDAVLDRLEHEERPYAIALTDVGENASSGPFYTSPDFDSLDSAAPQSVRHMNIYGRDWRVQFKARTAFVPGLGLPTPWLVSLVAAGLGLLSVAVWYLVTTARVRRRAAFLDHAQLLALVSGSSETIIACDPVGRITLWNAAAEKTLGYTPGEALGRNVNGMLVDEAGDPVFDDLSTDIIGEPHQLRRKDLGLADVLASLSVIRDPAGHMQGASFFLHDISHHLRAEEQFRRVVEASPSAILMVNEAGGIQLANAKAEELFGYPREELLGKTMDRLLPVETRGHHAGYIERYFQQPQARAMGAGRDLYGLRRDGARVPVEIGLNPINTAEGRFALAFIIDITERKRHEEGIMRLNATLEQQVLERTEQIRTYSSRLGAILQHAGYAIIATDLRGRITLFNPAAERMLGYEANEVTSSDTNADRLHDREELRSRASALSTQHHSKVSASFAQIAALTTCKGSDIAEWTYVCADGSRLPVALNVSTLQDDQDEASGFLIMASDLTEQKQRDSALHHAITAAEQANRSKSDFLANMSHEIRTPMNAILGMLYLLDRADLPVAAKDMTRKINVAARSLLSIINDVLDFSKIEAGRIELEHAPFDLAEVLDNVATLMASAVDTRSVEMLVSPTPEGARYLRGDALRLGQVLVNLVSNAIKFTERGEVGLRVSRLPCSDAHKIRLRFSVFDTGMGIPQEKQSMVFSPFSQVDSSTTRRFGGTGLGLSICRKLVTLMGGTLEVESSPGRGSTFFFTLDFPLASAPGDKLPIQGPWHVLVADDHDLAREHLSTLIHGFGWTTEEVVSGGEAVERVTTTNAKHCDVVLMDWQMHGMDGLAAAADIRRRVKTAQQPIIIMVTAFERKLVDDEVHRAAVDVVLTKPVTASVLYNTINETLSLRNPALRTRNSAAPSSHRLEGYRLLVVDDSEINREVAQRILEDEGAVVEQACDGREALNLLRDRPERCDAVLMDVQMPVMDGYEATRHIRASPMLVGMPIIALTAGAFKSQQDAALSAGMNAFVAKPFEVPDLIAAILRSTHTALQLRMPRPDRLRAVPDLTTGSVSDPASIPLLDVDKGLTYWRETGPYKRNLALFARRYENSVEGVQTCLARHDIQQASADLHRMRGAAAALAMLRLAAACAEVEECLAQRSDAADALQRMASVLAKTLESLQHYMQAGAIDLHPSSPSPDINPVSALEELLAALDSDSPEAIERALTGLPAGLPEDVRQRILLCIEEFDYRAAEHDVRALLKNIKPNSTSIQSSPQD